jgi:hypothetical protein
MALMLWLIGNMMMMMSGGQHAKRDVNANSV